MSKEKIKVFTGSGSFNPGEDLQKQFVEDAPQPVSYTHLRAHET